MVCGGTLRVQGDREQEWYERTRDRYLAETKFTENTDLQDLDRLLGLELQFYRWSQHLAAGMDYEGDLVADEQLRRQLKDVSTAITQLKAAMSLTKQARDDAAADGNFATWLADLKVRAKVFGMHREKQLTRSLVLMKELLAVTGTYRRSDSEERRKAGYDTAEDVLAWIDGDVRGRFEELDAYFRTHEQRYWVREL